MGWSCRLEAGLTLDQIRETCLKEHDSQNVWSHNGARYFYDIGREHDDGAITGKILRMQGDPLPDGRIPCKAVGSFRIEPDGKISRGPKHFRVLAERTPYADPIPVSLTPLTVSRGTLVVCAETKVWTDWGGHPRVEVLIDKSARVTLDQQALQSYREKAHGDRRLHVRFLLEKMAIAERVPLPTLADLLVQCVDGALNYLDARESER